MISRFNQLLLAFSIVSPLFLSIAVVLILLNPSNYFHEWCDMFTDGTIPRCVVWWCISFFIIAFIASWIWTKVFLRKLLKTKNGKKTISLASLQYEAINNWLPIITMLPPWLTLLMKEDLVMLCLTMTIIISLFIMFVLSRQGYLSLVFLLCGYRRYTGENINGMKIQLLTDRVWKNAKDIHNIVQLSDNYVLVV